MIPKLEATPSKCPICFDKLVSPVITNCNHKFCHFCIAKVLANKTADNNINNQLCPLCRCEITTLMIDKELANEIFEDDPVFYQQRLEELYNEYVPSANDVYEAFREFVDKIEQYPILRYYNYIYYASIISLRLLQIYILFLMMISNGLIHFYVFTFMWLFTMGLESFISKSMNNFKRFISAMYNNNARFQRNILVCVTVIKSVSWILDIVNI